MRSFALPKLSTSSKQGIEDSNMSATPAPYLVTPGHSRNSSSVASTTSSPVTPTFSTRSHVRYPSSSSSLGTTPESPANIAKSALDDLVEEPAERDDSAYDIVASHAAFEPMCICDTPFCEHRQFSVSPSYVPSPTTPEWRPGDDGMPFGELAATRTVKRQRSAEISGGKFMTRMSRGWPSISNRWRDRRPTTSISSPTVRSAPPSRESSARQHSVKQFLERHLESHETMSLPASSQETFSDGSWTSGATNPTKLLDHRDCGFDYDPIDRQQFTSTPLLPPVVSEMQSHTGEEIQSPLQSPSVATHSAAASPRSTPVSTPVIGSLPTPPLSAKPSFASIQRVRSNHGTHQSSDIPPMSIVEEADDWAVRLGHANFYVKPEPYLPEICDRKTCNRLLDDWEEARKDYMRRAHHISESYGPSSPTYKLAEQKWAEIDAQWRSNLDKAHTEAEANGQALVLQRLAETQPLPKVPSLVDPEHPDKFLNVNEADIVGPMVMYSSKVQRVPSKKANLLRIFTSPFSLRR